MGDYQKVEIKPDAAPAFTEEQATQGEQEAPQEVQEAPTPVERPGWLPEKFETPEALAFAYDKLQQEFTKSRSNEPAKDETPEPQTSQENLFNQLAEEFEATGEVSEEARETLAKQGIPRQFIDSYIDDKKRVAEASVQEVYRAVGGEENYQTMMRWAGENLSEQEIEVFNDMVIGPQEEMRMAIDGLYARFTQGGGGAKPLIQGDTSNVAPNSDKYDSRAQIVEAMKDSRYRSDPAYREEVYRRLSNSDVI